MKKRFLVILAACALFVAAFACTASADNGEISVYVDGTQVSFDVPPQSVNNRTMVPIRAIFEVMGADVQWDQPTQTAICTKNDTVVSMTVGSNVMSVNGSSVVMDVAPVAIDGRTLAPARYVAECFGADVQWDAQNNAVVISTSGVYVPVDIQTAPKITLYAADGRTISVDESEVAAYLAVGWYATLAEIQQTLYAADGRTITVYAAEVPAYLAAGWYATLAETQQTLYAADGRTITVYAAEVPAYLAAGWYVTLAETQQTLYAADGRTATVYISEVPAYLAVGWYSSLAEAQMAQKTQSKPSGSDSYNPAPDTYNPGPDGNVYRTPSGQRYHLDPNCGGKNSYPTTLQKAKNAGLTPCAKCAS